MSTSRCSSVLPIYILSLCSSASFSVIAPFFPLEASNKGMSSTMSGAIFSIYGFVLMIMNVIFGKLLPVIGVKRALISGIVLNGFATVVFGQLIYVQNFTEFATACFTVRIIAAIGASLMVTASYVCLINNSKSLGVYESFSAAGLAIGNGIGSGMHAIGGFTLPFIVLGSLTFVNIPIILRTINESDEIILFDSDDYSREKSTYAKLLCVHPSTILVYLLVVLTGITFTVVNPILQVQFDYLGFRPEAVGAAFFCLYIVFMISSPIVGYIVNEFNASLIMAFGLFITSVAFIFLDPSFFMNYSTNVYISMIGMMLIGCGFASTLIPSIPMILSFINKDAYDELSMNSLVSGLRTASASFGQTIGPSIGGMLFDSVGFTIACVIWSFITMTMAVSVALFICINRLLFTSRVTYETFL